MDGPAPDACLIPTQLQDKGPITYLVPEILAIIFGKLNVRDKCRAAQVCVAWKNSIYHPTTWRGVEVELRMQQSDSTFDMFRTLAKRGVRRIKVASGPDVSALFFGFPHLESLNVSNYKNGQGLELSSAFGLREPSRLTELRVSWCDHITDTTVAHIAKNVPNLVFLKLRGCVLLTDAALLHLANGLVRLKSLDLDSCCGVTDAGIGHLVGGRLELDFLGVMNCPRLTDDALRHLSVGQQSLRSFNMSNCNEVSDVGALHLAGIIKLEELNMFACRGINDLGLSHLARSSSLRRVNLRFCFRISDFGLAHLVSSTITSLMLGLCRRLTDSGIEYVSRMPNLIKLELRQCFRITDAALTYLAEGEAKLTSLDIRGCTEISKWALMRISFGLYRLHSLKLDRGHVNAQGMDRAATFLPFLSMLNIGGNNSIEVIRNIRTEGPLTDRPNDDAIASQFDRDPFVMVLTAQSHNWASSDSVYTPF